MTDILTTDKTIAAGSNTTHPSSRANRTLVIAIAVTVATTALFVAVILANGGGPATVDRATEAQQLRWEGIAATATATPAAQTANQLRFEGLAASYARVPAGQTASQLRWEGLAAASRADRARQAQSARWEAQAAAYGER